MEIVLKSMYKVKKAKLKEFSDAKLKDLEQVASYHLLKDKVVLEFFYLPGFIMSKANPEESGDAKLKGLEQVASCHGNNHDRWLFVYLSINKKKK